MSIIVIFALMFVSILLSIVFLGIWTYKDSSDRGLNATLWTIVVMVIPNLIGLLLYFIMGRGSISGKCKHCNLSIDKSSVYCKNCGIKVEGVNKFENKTTKKYLIGFVVSILITLLLFITFIIFAVTDAFSDNIDDFAGGISLMRIENDIGNKWNISYYKSNKIEYKEINLKKNSPKVFFAKGSCKEGSLHLTLQQGDKKETIDLTNVQSYKNIDLSQFKEDKLAIKLEGESAKNVEFKSYWK